MLMRPALGVALTDAGADQRGNAGHRRVLLNDGGRLQLQRGHGRNGNILRRLGGYDDGAGILLRQEALRYDDIQQHGADQRGGGDHQHDAVDGAARTPACGGRTIQPARRTAHPMRPGRLVALRAQQPARTSSASASATPRAETITATDRVTANSLNSRPTTPPMNSSGMNTATSETVSETMVKPICAGALERRLQRLLAGLDVADDVLDHDDRIIDHEAAGHRQRHEREIVQPIAKPAT